jgi:hypothetical protein
MSDPGGCLEAGWRVRLRMAGGLLGLLDAAARHGGRVQHHRRFVLLVSGGYASFQPDLALEHRLSPGRGRLVVDVRDGLAGLRGGDQHGLGAPYADRFHCAWYQHLGGSPGERPWGG